MSHFTKTEATRRIRAAKAVAASSNGYNPRALTAEVGIRILQHESIMPTWTDYEAYRAIAFNLEDDLSSFVTVKYAAADKNECARHGSIIHLYLYEREAPNTWRGQELVDVVTVWLGTPDESPRVHVPGNPIREVAA
jgi:hypothetical protein